MPALTRLQAGQASAVLAFESANRAFFAASVSDRGDEFFDQFTDRYDALLAEQEAGFCACYVPLGLEEFPLAFGDDLGGAVDDLDGGLIVDRVRRRRNPCRPPLRVGQ